MKQLLISIIITIVPFLSRAQEKPVSRWSLKAEALAQTTGAYAESIRIPGLKRQLADGKGIQLSAEYLYIDHKNWQLFQSAGIMQYWHPDQEKGFAAHTSLGYRRKIGAAYVEGLIGPSYLKTKFSRGQTQQTLDGNFYNNPMTSAGLTPTIALGAGYRINRRWSAYARYYHLAQLQESSAPQAVRLHRTLNVGIGFTL